MKVVVVDTSALIRLYVPDGPIPDDLEAHISSALRAETTLVIPELALAEFAQRFCGKRSKRGIYLPRRWMRSCQPF